MNHNHASPPFFLCIFSLLSLLSLFFNQLELKGLVLSECLQHAPSSAIVATSTLNLPLAQIHVQVQQKLGNSVSENTGFKMVTLVLPIFLLVLVVPSSFVYSRTLLSF